MCVHASCFVHFAVSLQTETTFVVDVLIILVNEQSTDCCQTTRLQASSKVCANVNNNNNNNINEELCVHNLG